MHYMGVMSGTSCDGIDLAVMNFDGAISTIATAFQPFGDSLKNKLLKVMANEPIGISDISQLDAELGHLYATAINEFFQSQSIKAKDIRAIGLHGQTVFHEPDSAYPNTIQLGSAAIVAKQTGLLTVANFRQLDVAHGGQGAPLAPIFHQQLFNSVENNVLVLNLGGIANVSLIQAEQTLGFDTGPANCLADEWIMRNKSKAYDDAGSWASEGQVNQALLSEMLAEPYFAKPFPKSTGRELFNSEWLDKHVTKFDLSAVDVQTTLLQLTVETVASGIASLKQNIDKVVVCGGGVHNRLMMKLLREKLNAPVISSSQHGIDPDYVEAALMAWLAEQNVTNNRLDLMAVTGANKPLIYGVQYIP